MKGQIIKSISGNYWVSSNNKQYICKSRGKLRNSNNIPIVGDYVLFDEKKNQIEKIEKRKNSFIRPLISNVDQVVIITSLKKPDFSANLLDKFLTIIEFNNVKPIICFTKLDLCTNKELQEYTKIIAYYKKIGYEIYTNKDISKFKNIFSKKTTVFTGQTGAGKSTLLNKLDKSLNLKTNEISKALNRGKHTTRHVELLSLLNGLIADTPGFSQLELIDMTKEDIRDNFIEFHKNSNNCKYRGCFHLKEPNCNIKKMVKEKEILQSRYDNYKKFIEEREF